MRIEMTERRTRLYENLLDATGENAKSKALDTAARQYLEMRRETTAIPTGALAELMELAVRKGSVTPDEIAEILSTDELPVAYESHWSIGAE